MKKTALTLAALCTALTGCGLSVVKKDNLAQGLDAAKTAFTNVQGQLCGDDATAKANTVYQALDDLIAKYGK